MLCFIGFRRAFGFITSFLHSNVTSSFWHANMYQYRKRLQPKGWAIEFGFRPFFWHQHIDRVHGLQGRSLREEGCTCCHHRGPCPSVLWKVNDVGRRSCSNTHFGTKRRHHMSTMHPPDILCHSPLLSMSWTTYGGI